jgi:DNA invertase Pin-like site-specific DNA recombinase
MSRKIVSYLRVSTLQQSESGLGLEAQRAAIEAHAKRTGSAIAREFLEVESGRNNLRPKLHEALAFARRAHATLVVARLDRLSRSMGFIQRVLDSNVAFAAADVPDSSRMTLQVLGIVADNECSAIRERTKAALAAAKARGVKLGTHNPAVPVLTPEARCKGQRLGSVANRRRAVEIYEDLAPFVADLRSTGFSLRQIAQRLNAEGHSTRNDRPWSAPQVLRLLQRAA